MAVIQNTMASSGKSSVERRSKWVPSAQIAAATTTAPAASGEPLRLLNSTDNSSNTPSAAAATPRNCRQPRRSPQTQRPHNATKTGMV